MLPEFRLANQEDLISICAYIRKHTGKVTQIWSDESLQSWVNYYIQCCLCAVTENENGLQAVVMGRPIGSLNDGVEDRYKIVWSGSILWVECCVSASGIRQVWKKSVEWLGKNKCQFTKVAWASCNHDGRLSVHEFSKFGKALFKGA